MPASKKRRLQEEAGSDAAATMQQTRVATSATRVTGRTLTQTNLAMTTGASTVNMDDTVPYDLNDPDMTVAKIMEAYAKRDAELKRKNPVVRLQRVADPRTLEERSLELFDRQKRRRIVQGRATEQPDSEEEELIR